MIIKKFLPIGIILLSFLQILVLPSNLINALTEKRDTLDNKCFFYNQYPFENYMDKIHSRSHQIENNIEPVINSFPNVNSIFSNGPMNSSWPMKSYNAQRIGRTPVSTADNPGIEKWRFLASTIGGVESGAAIASNGTIYFGVFNDSVYALNPDGTCQWQYKTGGNIYSVPAIAADGTIYIASNDCYLYAFNPDGTVKWRFHLGYLSFSGPVIAANGTIYISTAEGKVFAIDPNGTSQWCYNAMSEIYGDPTLGPDGTIYVGTWDNNLNAINPNGTLKWRFPTGDHVKGVPSIAPDGTIYFGSWDGYLYALNPNGTQKWRCHVGLGTQTTPAIATDGTIYVGGDYLYAVYPNGTIRWMFSLGPNRFIFHSCPAVSAEGTIYVGVDIGSENGGEILAVNANGTERWRKTISGNAVDSSPAIGPDGTVYIGSSTFYFHAFGKIESNQPPLTPTITGENISTPGRWAGFYVSGTDPDRNPIQFYINWGDGTNTNWTGEVASGETRFFSHTWHTNATYTVRVKTRDTLGVESNWNQTTINISGRLLELIFAVGRTENYHTVPGHGDEVQFTAKRLWVIDFKPFTIMHLTHGERLYVRMGGGIVKLKFTFGLFYAWIQP